LPESTHAPHVAPFRVDVHPERARVRVEPIGEVDLATADVLQQQLRELRESGFDAVVLDLRRVTFLDSTGIALILKEDRLAREAGLEFTLISGPPAVQRVLGMCGVVDELRFVGAEPPRDDPADQPADFSAASAAAL
jgi:anti-sigma B factor antagonist